MILVTGATGLLGSHLLVELLKSDRKVRALYRDKQKIKLVEQLFDYYFQRTTHRFNQIEWMQADVLDLVSLDDAFQGITEVYHCAALVSFNRKDFKNMIHVNRLGTANVVNFALKYGVKKLGHVSSTAVFTAKENGEVTEQTKWQISDTTSGYAISKYNSEREVWRATEEGLDVLIINPSVIFGAGNLSESSLAIFKTVKNGLKVYSPGCNAFVDARDVAHCFVQLMESNIKNERFLCVGHNLSFKESMDTIATAFSKKAPTICPPKWMALLMGRTNELLYRFFGIKPTITLESARSAYSSTRYSNSKIVEQTKHTFFSFQETVNNVVAFDKKRS
jgi:nucleoside-diphosphate-sugar epimerase